MDRDRRAGIEAHLVDVGNPPQPELDVGIDTQSPQRPLETGSIEEHIRPAVEGETLGREAGRQPPCSVA